MRQAPIDRIGSTRSKRLRTSGGSNMGEARRPADLWQRHLGEGPPRRGRMTWDECQSKLLALTAEVARSAPATSPEKVEDFLRTEREIGLVEELAAFICEHFREVDEWGEAVGSTPADARARAADPLGPLVARFALVREIAASREYAIRFLDLSPQDVHRLSRLLAA